MKIGYVVVALLAVYFVGLGVLGKRAGTYAGSFRSSITAGKSTSLLPLIGVAMGSHIGSGFVVGNTEYGATYGSGGVWWKKGTAKGAFASSIVGIAILLLDYTGVLNVPYECLLPLIPAAAVYVVVSLVTQPGGGPMQRESV